LTLNSYIQNKFEIVTDCFRLAEIADIIGREKEIALDLEMDSLHHYQEKICLLQISTRTETWLVDPLALQDISPLAAPLGERKITIVMHGADYDIRSLRRDFGIEITTLFDTMLASRFLGIQEFGLAALLKSRFGIELDKKYQKADWSKRPLTREMSAYAAADTATLLALHDGLKAELVGKKRLDWLHEECALLCSARAADKSGPFFLSCKGAGRLKPRNLAVLENLLHMRDQLARGMDRPPFKVMPSESLIEIAEKRARTLQELQQINGMTQGQIRKYGEKIISTVSSSLDIPENQLPSFPNRRKKIPTESVKRTLQQLKGWRSGLSNRLCLEPGVLAPNWLLENLADKEFSSLEGFSNITGMREWQKNLYGAELADMLQRPGDGEGDATDGYHHSNPGL